MDLIYRGTRHQVDYPSLDLVTLAEPAMFMGARFNRKHYSKESPSLGQERLTYRGVHYHR